jgi:MFS transporter, PAT family, beta-lactamase induction signal transducer AmpG
MSLSEHPENEALTSAPLPERPWLINFLIAPEAVISVGLINGALSFLLRNEGVDPARVASIVGLLTLPHTIYFLWGPITDFFLRRRTWVMFGAVTASLALLLAFNQPRLGSSLGVALLFLTACLGVLVAAACGGLMGALRSEVSRRRASSFYQSGSLAFGGLAVFLIAYFAHLSLSSLGWILAAMIVLPSLSALAVPPQPEVGAGSARESDRRIWAEFKSTFLRREAIPYTLLITFPACSGAMIGLLPELARDYGISGNQVAWMNGLAGALLTAAGALTAALVPVRVPAPVAYLVAGLINAGTLAILALSPMRPQAYFIGTVLFLFSVGACYAFFTGVALEFLGQSGKSGSARYAIINSFGNLPVAYMSWVDGRGYAKWGPRAMPGIDAALSTVGVLVLLAHFITSRRRRLSRERAMAEAAVGPFMPEA